MKKYGLLFLFVILLVLGGCKTKSMLEKKLQSPKNGIFYTNLDDAKKMSKATHKPIMVDLYTDWCVWCKRLDKNTYSDTAVKQFINDHLIPLKINAEKEPYLAKKFKITGYPSIMFIDADENELDRLIGYYDAKKFLAKLTDMFIKGKTFVNIKKKWNREKSFKLGKEYLSGLEARHDIDGELEVTKELIKMDPSDTEVLATRFNILFSSGKWKDDEKDFLSLATAIGKRVDKDLKSMRIFYYFTMAQYYKKKGEYKIALNMIDEKILTDPKIKNNKGAMNQFNFFKFNIYIASGNINGVKKMLKLLDKKYLPVNFAEWIKSLKSSKKLVQFGKLNDTMDKFLQSIGKAFNDGKDITTDSKDIVIPNDPNSGEKLIYKCELDEKNKQPMVLIIETPDASLYGAKRIYWDLTKRNIVFEL